MSCVYVRVFPNKKVYVGKCTGHPKQRFCCPYGGKMADALAHFGKENVKSYYVETIHPEEDESLLIGWFDSVNRGYNTQRGHYPYLADGGKNLVELLRSPHLIPLIDAVEREVGVS